MTKGKKHIRDLPHADPLQEIDMLIKNLPEEIKNNEFISAHYKLKRLLQLIYSQSNIKGTERFKQKYQQLNNELNIRIIDYLNKLKK